MRVLTLDCDLGVGEDHFQFGSNVALFDYDVVFWDPAATLSNYVGYGTYQGRPSLAEDASARLRNSVTRRHKEFLEFIELGRCLVVFLPGETEVYIDTGERKYSGTGRNRATTRLVSEFDLLSAIPANVTRSVGRGTEMVPANDTMASLYRTTSDYWVYQCSIDSEKTLRPLLHIKGTTKSVAGMIRAQEGGGCLILLPELRLPFADEPQDDGHDDDDDSAGELQMAGSRDETDDEDDSWPGDRLLAWIESLLTEPDASLPAWANQLRFPSEVERESREAALEEELATVQERLDSVRAEQAQDERWKSLMTASGPALERRVREAFEFLGFEMNEGEPGRTDLRGSIGGANVVLEVKGVSKSAAEKNAAQLEKWVSEDLSQGRSAKGILVVNTWRDTPARSRADVDFPDQMLSYCQQRGHCLVTGVQLLVMVRTCMLDPVRKPEAAQLLLRTTGRLEGWSDLNSVFAPAEAEPTVLKQDEDRRDPPIAHEVVEAADGSP